MNNYPPGLLDMLGIKADDLRRQQQQQGLLAAGLQLLAGSGYSPNRRTTGELLGQAGAAGLGAYQQAGESAIDRALKQMQIQSALAEKNAPKYMTLKTPSGGEALIQIPRGGAPSAIQIPGMSMTKPIDFDPQTQAFIDFKFGKSYAELSPEQKAEVLKFNNAPNDEKVTTLKIEAEKQGYETGVKVPIPRGRGEFFSTPAQPSVAPAPAPAVQVAPTPRAEPAIQKTADVVTSVPKNLQLPANVASQPLKTNEVPLIQSAAITPKQKNQLEMEKPQTITATEYGLNQIRQTRNTIRELLADPNFDMAFGFGGELVSNVYTPAADVRAKLESLRDQQFARNITAMRDASKTGAAVGNVTQQEGSRFENMQGSLRQFQSAKQARQVLERMEKELADSEGRVVNSFSRYYGPQEFSVLDLFKPPEKTKTLDEIFFPKRKK